MVSKTQTYTFPSIKDDSGDNFYLKTIIPPQLNKCVTIKNNQAKVTALQSCIGNYTVKLVLIDYSSFYCQSVYYLNVNIYDKSNNA